MKTALLSFFMWYSHLLSAQEKCTINIQVDGIENAKGTIRICAFSSAANYLVKSDLCVEKRIKSKESISLHFEISCVPIALVVYHDLNDNGQLDKNFMGIPNEPYGFPDNPSTLFGPPSFKNATIDPAKINSLHIKF